jgi:hypothetical protein
MFLCPKASQVWQAAHLWGFVHQAVVECASVDGIVFQLLQKVPASQCSLLAMLLWSLWKRRNLKLWQQHDESTAQVLARAKHVLEDWQLSQQMRTDGMFLHSSADTVRSSSSSFEWQRPNPGRFKCNVDASFSPSANKVGVGMCIRDSAGGFVQARTLSFQPACAVDIGEALGLDHAIQWVAALQLDGVDFCLDSQVVVNEFHGIANNATDLGSIISHCRQMFTKSIYNGEVFTI